MSRANLIAAMWNEGSLDGCRPSVRAAFPSAETYPQISEGVGMPSTPSGTGTSGAVSGTGRLSKQPPSALYLGPGESQVLAAEAPSAVFATALVIAIDSRAFSPRLTLAVVEKLS